VIDSARIDAGLEAWCFIRELLPKLKIKKLLIIANKQDLPLAIPVTNIINLLSISTLKDITWHIVAACAVSGDGIYEGLDFLLKKNC